MIVSSLCEYYNKVCKFDKNLLQEGYSKLEIDYIVSLTSDGEIDGIIDVSNRKENKQYGIFPFRYETSSPKPIAYIVEHRSLYLFGLVYKDGKLCVDKKDSSSNSQKATADAKNKAFKETTISFFQDIQSPIAQAFYNFANSWNPDEQTENRFLLSLGGGYSNRHFAFCLSGRPDILLHEDEAVKLKWEVEYEKRSAEQETDVAQCSIYGKMLPIARLHDKVEIVVNGKHKKYRLVCMNNEAEMSYCKKQSFNSGISIRAMKEYTQAWNYLVSLKKHATHFDEMNVLHFALTKDENPYLQYVNDNIFAESSDEATVKDIEGSVKASLELVKKGKIATFETPVNDNIEYCIFGAVPNGGDNGGRISVRFFYRNTFGAFRRNVERFNEDFAIENSTKAPAIGVILKQLLPCKKDDSKEQEKGKSKKNEDKKESKQTIPPDLCESLFMAMLQGTPFPQKLLQTVVRRIKTDVYKSDWFINDTRAGFVKACLNRNYKKDKEKIKVALDTQNKTPAYLCGRLFAVLEIIQKISQDGKETNRTIKNTYFSSACATPAVVFPKVIKLSNVHQEKRSDGLMFYYSTLIGEIIDGLNGEFPKTLSLEEQGMFIIGYYHQKNYKSKEENITEEN